ncbi:hypothetical protein SK128_024662, partial [Halocaridina rubra]
SDDTQRVVSAITVRLPWQALPKFICIGNAQTHACMHTYSSPVIPNRGFADHHQGFGDMQREISPSVTLK